MIVYIAEGHTDYAGFEILGVYTTREAAEARCDYVREHIASFDDIEINEFEVGKPYYCGVKE